MTSNDLLDRLEALGHHIDAERETYRVMPMNAAQESSPSNNMTRLPLVGAFAVVLVLAGVAGLVAITLRNDARVEQPASQTTAAAPSTTSTPTITGSEMDQLLFPSINSPGLQIGQASTSPAPSGRAAGTLMSPSGDLFGIASTKNFWGALPNEWAQRDVGVRRFGVGDEMGSTVYATVDPCDLISVKDPRANTTLWADDVTALLSSMTINGGVVSIPVPAGWTSVGTGSVTTLYGLTYTVQLDGVTRSVSLMQMPGTPVGALLAQSQWGPAMLTDLGDADHVPAWFITPHAGTFTFLAWTDESGSAVLLGSDHAAVNELKKLAATLQFDQADKWASSLSGTADPSAVTIASDAAPGGRTCSPRTIELHQ